MCYVVRVEYCFFIFIFLIFGMLLFWPFLLNSYNFFFVFILAKKNIKIP